MDEGEAENGLKERQRAVTVQGREREKKKIYFMKVCSNLLETVGGL